MSSTRGEEVEVLGVEGKSVAKADNFFFFVWKLDAWGNVDSVSIFWLSSWRKERED